MANRDSSYKAYLTTIGVDATQLTVNNHGTIVDTTLATTAKLHSQLPLLQTEDSARGPADVRFQQLLGEGGMGRVFSATQLALQRDVAVKQLHAGIGTEGAVELLREALIAARLEHPNIVPVYMLGRTPDGRALLVMKRIEGVPWGAVLAGDSAAPGIFSNHRDALEFHTSVFLKVCEAVHFAHSRSILHRDLKPDNVMLGSYGEVYVLDWGLAVSLAEDPLLPLALDVHTLEGTPAYMAPEMAAAKGTSFSVRTDVFLLGAILYHVLMGRPPHEGHTIIEQLAHAYDPPPLVFDKSVPEELAQICARAMRRNPAERFASVEELRRAVQDAMLHRNSWRLAQEAARSAEQLKQLLAKSEEQRTQADGASIQALFSECRFGYRQALTEWKENPAANEGLHAVLVTMITYELARQNPRAAAELQAQLTTEVPELSARIREGLQSEEEEQRRLEKLAIIERETDVRHGQKIRGEAALGVGVLWSGLCVLVGWLERTGRHSFGYRDALLAATLFAFSQLGGAIFVHRVAGPTEVQTRVLVGAVAAAFGFINHWLVCSYFAVPFPFAMVLFLLWVAGGWIIGGILIDRRMIPSGLVFGAASFLTVLLPSLRFELMGGSLLFSYLVLWLQLRKHAEPDAPLSLFSSK